MATASPTPLARLRALSPFGPIFGKELRVTARLKRTYVLRTLYLLVLFLFLLAVWSSSHMAYVQGVAAQARMQEEMGLVFFSIFTVFSATAMGVLGPVLTATTISSERLGKTLNVLLMTPITTWQILSGKLLSRLLIAFTLIGLTLPVLALVRLLGGVELYQMAGSVCLAVVIAMTTAAIGLLFSTFLNRAYAVILLSYATILFLYLFVPFVLIVGFEMHERRSAQFLSTINPGFCVGMLVSGPMSVRIDWLPCVVVHLLFTGGLVLASGASLRRVTRRSGGQPAAVNPEEYIPIATALRSDFTTGGDDGARTGGGAVRLSEARAGTTPAVPTTGNGAEGAAGPVTRPPPPPLPVGQAVPPQPIHYASTRIPPRSPSVPRDVSDNPVLWREVRRPLTARRWQAVLFGGLAGALLLITYAVLANDNDLDEPDAQIGYAIVFHGLFWLLVAVVSATAIAQEKESDTWTLLLATPVTGPAIVWGKAVGLMRRMLWPFVLIVAHFLLFTLTGVINIETFLLVVWVLVSFNSIWLATGLYLSLRLRKVTFAVILNLLLAVIAYPLVALLAFVGGELVDRGGQQYGRRGEAYAEQVAWYLPYTYLGIGIEGLNRGYNIYPYNPNDPTGGPRFWLPRALSFDPRYRNANLPYSANYYQRLATKADYLGIVFVVGCVYLGLSAWLLLWTARRFDRIVGRASQQPAPASAGAEQGPPGRPGSAPGGSGRPALVRPQIPSD